MKFKINIILFSLIFISIFAYAQKNKTTIYGFVNNQENEKIEGASIFVNSKLTSITNVNGYFEINLSCTDTLEIRSLNYEYWSNLAISLPKQNVRITLKKRFILLAEVSIVDNTSFIIDSILKKASIKMCSNNIFLNTFIRQWISDNGKYSRVNEAILGTLIHANTSKKSRNKSEIYLFEKCSSKDSLKSKYKFNVDSRDMIERGLKSLEIYFNVIKGKHQSKMLQTDSTIEVVVSNDTYVLNWVINKKKCVLEQYNIKIISIKPQYNLNYYILYQQQENATFMHKLNYRWEAMKRNVKFIIGEELYFNFNKLPKPEDIVDNFKHNDLKDYKSNEGDCAIIEKYKTDFNIPSFTYDR